MRESDTYQAILEEGMATGIATGMAKGKAEGLAEGQLSSARAMLLRLGTRRWGPPTPATKQRLDAIGDLEQLQGLTDRLLDASGWDELLRESIR